MEEGRQVKKRKKKHSDRAKYLRSLFVILIVAGLMIIGYSGYQWLSLQREQAALRESHEAAAGFRNIHGNRVEIGEYGTMRLIIPAIDVDLMVVSDVDTYDREEMGRMPYEFPREHYQQWLDDLKPLLDKGPVHYQLSDLPSSEGGNVVISGHRAGHWNFFRHLDQLEKGDEIHLEMEGYRFTYLVDRVVQVDAHDWTMFYSTDKPSITLQTCTPLGVPNPPYRLNARGVLKEVTTLAAEEEIPETPEVD